MCEYVSIYILCIYIYVYVYIYRDVYTRKLHDSLALRLICLYNPEGPTYTTIMELGAQNQNRDGFFGGGPNSIHSVYGPSG